MEINITKTDGRRLLDGGRFNRICVECPECGHGGASDYPCWCSKCQNLTLMLPVQGSTLKNWNEVFEPDHQGE